MNYPKSFSHPAVIPSSPEAVAALREHREITSSFLAEEMSNGDDPSELPAKDNHLHRNRFLTKAAQLKFRALSETDKHVRQELLMGAIMFASAALAPSFTRDGLVRSKEARSID